MCQSALFGGKDKCVMLVLSTLVASNPLFTAPKLFDSNFCCVIFFMLKLLIWFWVWSHRYCTWFARFWGLNSLGLLMQQKAVVSVGATHLFLFLFFSRANGFDVTSAEFSTTMLCLSRRRAHFARRNKQTNTPKNTPFRPDRKLLTRQILILGKNRPQWYIQEAVCAFSSSTNLNLNRVMAFSRGGGGGGGGVNVVLLS